LDGLSLSSGSSSSLSEVEEAPVEAPVQVVENLPDKKRKLPPAKKQPKRKRKS
jgi:hypothetical protein